MVYIDCNVHVSQAQSAGERRTEGIEGPQAFGEALLLPERALIQAMVCETVHKELCCSSVHESKRVYIRLRLVLQFIAK